MSLRITLQCFDILGLKWLLLYPWIGFLKCRSFKVETLVAMQVNDDVTLLWHCIICWMIDSEGQVYGLPADDLWAAARKVTAFSGRTVEAAGVRPARCFPDILLPSGCFYDSLTGLKRKLLRYMWYIC